MSKPRFLDLFCGAHVWYNKAWSLSHVTIAERYFTLNERHGSSVLSHVQLGLNGLLRRNVRVGNAVNSFLSGARLMLTGNIALRPAPRKACEKRLWLFIFAILATWRRFSRLVSSVILGCGEPRHDKNGLRHLSYLEGNVLYAR